MCHVMSDISISEIHSAASETMSYESQSKQGHSGSLSSHKLILIFHFRFQKHRVRADKETDHLAKIKGTAYVLPGSEVTCMPVVDEAPGWKPHYPKHKPGQTHDEYFRDRIRGSRRPQHQKK
jgi:hypothetical protein